MSSERTYPHYPQQVYLGTNSTQGSLTITAGRKALDKASGQIYLSGSTVHRVVPLSGARGAAFQFFGTDAENEALAAVRIWAGSFANWSGATQPGKGYDAASFIDIAPYGDTGAVTWGTCTGAGTGDLVPSTSFIADTIASWTVSSYSTIAETVYGLGGSDEFSPTGNVPATLFIPNFGPHVHAFIIEFDLNTAASANAVYWLTA